MSCKKLVDGVEQTIAEIGQPSADQADRCRQGAAEEILRSGGSEGRVAGDSAMRRGMPSGEEEVIGDVAEESGIERGCFIEAQRRHQAGLGAPWRRRLCHEGNAARRWGSSAYRIG